MFWARRKREPLKQGADDPSRQLWPEPGGYNYGLTGLTGPDTTPTPLLPKLNERKTRVFDDETEPEWRDPDTEA